MRIAILIQGGIGGGNFSQGYPALLNFVEKISLKESVTVYSILPANEDFKPKGFLFRTCSRTITNRKIRTLLLIFIFIRDHIKERYKIIHAFWVYPAGTMAVLLGKLLRVPNIVTVQGGEAAAIKAIGYGNMLKPWLRRVTLWTCEQATSLNTISLFLVNQLKSFGLRRNDTTVIPFGAEVKRFTYHSKKIIGSLHLIHVANLTEVKDQVTLLKAFAIIREHGPCELRIVGADYLNGKLQKTANELGIEKDVKFLGAVPQDELPIQYLWADVMLHTSLHEGQSGVVVEAMASGVVVCGTPVGIMYDLGNDFFKLIAIGDYKALANTVIELWRYPERHLSLSKKSFEWATIHNADWTASKFITLYDVVNNVGTMK